MSLHFNPKPFGQFSKLNREVLKKQEEKVETKENETKNKQEVTTEKDVDVVEANNKLLENMNIAGFQNRFVINPPKVNDFIKNVVEDSAVELEKIKNDSVEDTLKIFNSDKVDENTNNITSDNLVELYTFYMSTGASGKENVVLVNAFINIENNKTPEEVAKEFVEKYLKDNNISNITTDEVMDVFKKIDDKLKSAHNVASKQGYYNKELISDMWKTIESICVKESLARITKDTSEIYNASKTSEDTKTELTKEEAEEITEQMKNNLLERGKVILNNIHLQQKVKFENVMFNWRNRF